MNKLMLTLGLTAALAACTEDHTIVADSTPDDNFNAVGSPGTELEFAL